MKMIRYFRKPLLFVAAVLLWNTPAAAGPRDEQVVNVSVYVDTLNDHPAYHYVVENKGSHPVIGVSIGFDHYTGDSELQGTHPLNVISPGGWQSRIIALEESPFYEVRFEPLPGESGLQPNASLSGFIIIMDSARSKLRNGHWTAIISGPPTYASSRLSVLSNPPVVADTTPPTISVSVDPTTIWPPNNKMKEVTASVVASDDRDPSPIISLVSVSCNECASGSDDIQDAEVGTADTSFSVKAARTGKAKPGRVYTIVYSATDSAGNRSEGSATITVPHDQRPD